MVRTARPEEAEAMRRRLVRAAYGAIAELGFAAVTLQEVASRAGVSKALPLYYFASKEALFAAVMERTAETVSRRAERAVVGAVGPRAQMEAYLDSVCLGAAAHREFYRVYLDFLSQGLRNPSLSHGTLEFILGCRVLEEQIVVQGTATGAFRRSLQPADAAASVRALIDGLSLRWLFSADESYDEFRQRLHRVVFDYLAP